MLEEHLRKWCDRAGCAPSKPSPTLADYNMELYKANHLDKIAMKHVDAMTAIGNDTAHNASTLKREDVDRLLREVRNLLQQHPLS